MTVASGFVPQQSDPASADMRAQEPSMEDILASIRRIIADDQTQGLRPDYDPPRRDASMAEEAAAEPDRMAGSAAGAAGADRARQRPRKSLEGALDLASLPGAAFVEGAPSAFEERRPASNMVEPAFAHEPGNSDEQLAAQDSHGSFQESVDAAPAPPAPYRDGPDQSVFFRAHTIAQPVAQVEHAPPPAPAFEPDEQDEPPPQVEDPASSGDALISPALGASVMSAFETLAGTVVLQNTEMLERTMRELLRPMVKTWLDENLPTLVERLVRHEIERVARGGRS